MSKQKLSNMIRIVSEYIGKVAGSLLLVFPLSIRFGAARFLGVFSRNGGRFSLFLTPFAYETVKKIFRYDYGKQLFLKRTFPEDFSFLLDITKKTQRQLYLYPVYEEAITNYIKKSFPESGTFIDVGAHVGYYTVLASRVGGERSRVVSIEPEKQNFGNLEKNIALNNLKNITPLRVALSDMHGTMTLHMNPLNDGGNSLNPQREYHDSGEVRSLESVKREFSEATFSEEVEVSTLDALVTAHLPGRSIDLVKIDVESHELFALKGARGLIQAGKLKEIICEVGVWDTQLKDFLSRHSLDIYSFARDRDVKKIPLETARTPGNYLFRCRK